MSKPAKILFKLPSRGRPERFFKALDSIIDNLQDLENYWVSCTIDSDDTLMNNEEVISRIRTRKNVSIECGLSDSKIHAVNRSIPDIEWDIIVIDSDDIYFNIFGFDSMIRQEMLSAFPDGDGYLHFRESDSKEHLNVMTVCDKKYYDRFSYIYHPSYISLWADNEQTEVAKILGKYRYIPYEIMLHRNPAYGYSDCPKDEMFNQHQSFWGVDEVNFYKRKALNFDL